MGTILKTKRKEFFKSIRWKLVSTYLILITFVMILTIIFVEDYLTKSNIDEAENNLLSQNTQVANQIAPFIGNVDNEYTYRYVEDIIKQHSFEYNSRIIVLDTQTKVLLDSYDLLNDQKVSTEEIDDALLGFDSANIYVHDSKYVFYAAVPIIEHNEIVGTSFITSSADYIFSDVGEIIDKLLLIFTAAVAVSIFISILFAQIISKPIEKLTDSVQHITLGKYDTKVDISSKDEIGELGDAFNMMTTKLSQVDERRKKFVSNVSHELRTPMTSMKIVSDTLLSSPSWDEAVYREFMEDINSEIDRLNKIIDSLLYLVRVEKDDLDLNYNMTYVNYLLEWVIKTIKPIADTKNITVAMIANSKIQIQLDQEKIQQCLLNIIGNAVKYTPENGKVCIELIEQKEQILINIIDNGIGIPERDLPFIFDRFYRVDEARARKTGGTGLGLAISQQIVLLHQGRIEVSSNVGEGTTVSISLPRK